MQLLSDLALDYLRRVAVTGFVDTCQRLVPTAVAGDYGTSTGKSTYTADTTIACLFKPKLIPDEQGASAVEVVDADLYLPLTATLLPDDRVTITHLHGDAVAEPQTFAIVGGPVLGKTMLLAELSLITDEE